MRVSQSGSNQVQGSEVSSTKKTNRAAQAEEAKKGDKKSNATANGGVAAEISARGKEAARAKTIATDTPDVREEKIAELKKRIAAGKYNVNPDAVADKMVDDHMRMSMPGLD